MSKTLYPLISLLIAICLSFISGCATMSKSECQVANWEIIGMEDGSAGRPTSHLGQHRSACAEHGVAPDLNAYMKGHERGVQQFCTYQNGFNQGNSGRGYSGVCPSHLAGQFTRGYNIGKQHYSLRTEIGAIKNSLSRHHSRLDQIGSQIQKKEDAIVAGNTTVESRRRLLEEINVLREERDAIEYELPVLESELFELEERYTKLQR
ncbi:MAG: DUF2799 domain-containing protein [Kangiellaceae bacterium]|nr:DUF2799 domain-containing protein [Kangiellaceae bacterium]MCW9000329.1 DUF2799 domain-containing protein [Kangiellaceae bacterium]